MHLNELSDDKPKLKLLEERFENLDYFNEFILHRKHQETFIAKWNELIAICDDIRDINRKLVAADIGLRHYINELGKQFDDEYSFRRRAIYQVIGICDLITSNNRHIPSVRKLLINMCDNLNMLYNYDDVPISREIFIDLIMLYAIDTLYRLLMIDERSVILFLPRSIHIGFSTANLNYAPWWYVKPHASLKWDAFLYKLNPKHWFK